MTGGKKFTDDEIRNAKTSCDLAALFAEDGCAIERSGGHVKVCCPFHADRTPSLEIYAKDQSYYCFGCKAHGDAITYLREKRGLPFDEAMAVLGQAPKVTMPAKVDRRVKWQIEMPAPAKAGMPRCSDFRDGRPVPASHVWAYLDAEGRILFCDARYDYEVEVDEIVDGKPTGKKLKKPEKDFRPWSWQRNLQGESRWRKGATECLPLFGLDQLAKRSDATVLLVEGPKKAVVGQRHFPEFVVMAWPGGTGRAATFEKIDWSPLAGRNVILWPDCDWVGANAMQFIAAHLAVVGAAAVQAVDLTPNAADLEKGWDVADGDEAMCRRILADGLGEPTAAIKRMLDAFPPPDHAKPKAAADDDQVEEPAGDDAQPPPDEPAAESAADDDDTERNEVQLATEFIRDHRDNLRYLWIDEKNSRWLIWDEQRWKRDETGHIVHMAEQTMKRLTKRYEAKGFELFKLANETKDEDKAKGIRREGARWMTRASAIQSKASVTSMLYFARSRPGVTVSPFQLDAQMHLLNTASGTLDRRTGRLHKPRREDMITKLAPVEYDPKADRSRLLQVLNSTTGGDRESATYLQHMLGSSILYGNRFEKVHFLVGPGGSGKGTLFGAIQAALGDYAASADPQTFAKAQGQRIRSDIIRLQGARLVIASESDRTDVLDTQVIKLLSGNDVMVARFLYGRDEEFLPTFTIWFQCNSEPRIPDDTDSGVWRRWVEVPTGAIIPEDERDPDLKSWLRDPQRGGKAILAWLIEGGLAVGDAKHVPLPKGIQEATAKYRQESDPLAGFLLDCCRFGPVREVAEGQQFTKATYCLGSDLTKAYMSYCDGELIDRRHRLSGKGIAKRLRTLGCHQDFRDVMVEGERKPGRCWCGITLFDVKEHAAKGLTYVPSNEEHTARLPTSLRHHTSFGNPHTRDGKKCSEMPTLSQSNFSAHVRDTSKSSCDGVIMFDDISDNKKELKNKNTTQPDPLSDGPSLDLDGEL
jgi:P4 family phage/plasmid primase-like protien